MEGRKEQKLVEGSSKQQHQNKNHRGSLFTSSEIRRFTGSSTLPLHVPLISNLLKSGGFLWGSSVCLAFLKKSSILPT